MKLSFPTPPHFHSGWDFDIADANNVWVGALSGLYHFQYTGTQWASTAYTSITGVNFVGVSRDRSIIYVVTGLTKIDPLGAAIYTNLVPGTNALYAFNAVGGVYFNGGSPILTPTGGLQFRGVSMAPIAPTPSSSATMT